MIDIGVLHMSGSPIRDRQQLFDAGLSLPALNSGISLPERFLDDTGHALPGGARDGLRELMSFWIFDVEAHQTIISAKM